MNPNAPGSILLSCLLVSLAAAAGQPSAEKETDETLHIRITERLSRLSQPKLEALMQHIGRKTPKGFYNCICVTGNREAGIGVAVLYHPDPHPGSPACENPAGGPCVASGLGCWRFHLPSDPATWKSCVGNARYEDGSTLVDAVAGAVQKLREDKREAARKRALPHWMKYPSQVDGYALKLNRLFTKLALKGYPVNKLKKLNALLRAHIMRLNTPGKLPTFWQSLGLAPMPSEDRWELDKWRKGLLAKYDRYFLGLMGSQNPLTIARGLRRYAKAMSRYDEAGRLMAEGALDELAGDQKLVSNILEAVPGVGDAIDGFALVGYLGEKVGLTDSRNWTLTGEQVTALDAFLRFAARAAPTALEKLVKRSAPARGIVKGIGGMERNFGRSSKKVMSEVLDGFSDSSRKGFKKVRQYLARVRKQAVDAFEQDLKVARKAFKRTREYAEAAARRAADVGEARKLLGRLQKSTPGSAEYRELVIELQKNKTAQWLVNSDEFTDALRKDINSELSSWYKKADLDTASDIRRFLQGDAAEVENIARELNIDPAAAQKFRAQAEAFARKHGKNLDELEIDTLKITNRRPGKKSIGVGRDRDLTDQLVIQFKDADGKIRRLTMDVDHRISEHLYERNFYKNLHGGELSSDPAEIHRWVHEQMDQTVTSKWHPEAYNVGEVNLDDFLDKGITPTINRPEDVADTIVFKSSVWFKRADDAASALMKDRNTAEGMRQATKQWKDLIMSRVKQYGLPEHVVPERLEKAMLIFKRVASGKMTAAEGEHFLKTMLNTDKESVVRQMGAFFEGMEKTSGKVYRATRGLEAEKAIRNIVGQVGPGETLDGLRSLYGYLRTGEISPERFRRLQSELIGKRLHSFRSAAEARQWAKAALESNVISQGQYSNIMQKAARLEKAAGSA